MKLNEIIRFASVFIVIALVGALKYHSMNACDPRPKGELRVENNDSINSPNMNNLILDDDASNITAYIN